MSDDSQLVDRAMEGDRLAFGLLVRMHQDRLFAAMLHVAGTAEEAEDVVQEAFVTAFTKLHMFQRNSQWFTWLYRIAFNCALNKRRRSRRETSVEQMREAGGSEPVDQGHRPDDPMLQLERVEMVRRALDRLSEDHRRILILREMDGCSYESIAEVLNISLGTVRSRLSRAREQLRSAIEELYGARLRRSQDQVPGRGRLPH